MLKLQPPLSKIFDDVYKNQLWGISNEKFYSGHGSHDTLIVEPYIDKIYEMCKLLNLFKQKFLDIGCGDFAIGRRIAPWSSQYIGIDVVYDLIQYNIKHFQNDNIKFYNLDATNEELPSADVCFVRQVLQHLTNFQIQKILNKLKNYKYVFITEHLPSNYKINSDNINKTAGGNIRLDYGSGVFLSSPPFNLPEKNLKEILRCNVKKSKVDAGQIVTFLYHT